MLRQALAANLNKRQRRLQDIDVGREIFLGRREAVGVAMGVVAVLVLLLVIAWVSFTQVGGRQQLDVLSPHDVARTRQLVGSLFGIAWSPVPGRGDDNFKPRLRAYAPTLSISYRPTGGGTEVQIWCSEFQTKVLLMAHAQLMWRKKRSVASAIAQRSTLSPTNPMPFVPGDPQERRP